MAERANIAKRRAQGVVVALSGLVATVSTSCSLALSFDGFGGPTDASSSGSTKDGAATTDALRDVGADALPTDDGRVSAYDGSACGNAGVCVQVAPPNWGGPVTLFAGPTSAAAPACPGGTLTAYTGNSDPSAGPDSCSQCSCASATEQTCSTPQITAYDGTCMKPIGSPVALTATACASWGNNDATTVSITASTPTGGSCVPSTSAVTNTPAPTWGQQVVACNAVTIQGSCSANSTCVEGPQSPFSAYCIYQTGDVMCPAGGDFSERFVYYGGVSDGRTCSPCACGSPSGGTCAATATLYNDVFCTSPDVPSVPVPTTSCVGADDDDSARLVAAPVVKQASSCAATGGEPIGTVTEASPTTICCAL